jgi:hypothetical protein
MHGEDPIFVTIFLDLTKVLSVSRAYLLLRKLWIVKILSEVYPLDPLDPDKGPLCGAVAETHEIWRLGNGEWGEHVS